MIAKDALLVEKDPEFERFVLRNSIAELESDCLIWTGSIHPRWEYPYQHWNGVRSYIHRLAYEIFRGPLNRGDIVRRSCGHGLCVNPDHLVRQRIKKGACTLSEQAQNFPQPSQDEFTGFDWAAFYGGFDRL